MLARPPSRISLLHTCDRRRAPRVPVRKQVEVSPFYDGRAGNSFTVELRDFSLVGIGFVSPRGLPANSQFTIRVASSTGGSVELLYDVVRCLPDEGGYRVGGDFTCAVGIQSAPLASSERDRIREAILA